MSKANLKVKQAMFHYGTPVVNGECEICKVVTYIDKNAENQYVCEDCAVKTGKEYVASLPVHLGGVEALNDYEFHDMIYYTKCTCKKHRLERPIIIWCNTESELATTLAKYTDIPYGDFGASATQAKGKQKQVVYNCYTGNFAVILSLINPDYDPL